MSKSKKDLSPDRAYGYICTSDMNILVRDTLESQQNAIIEYCKKNNLNLVKIYLDKDRDMNQERNGMKDLLNVISPDDFVITCEFSNFAKDSFDYVHQYHDITKKRGCTFICFNPPLDSRQMSIDAMSIFYFSIINHELKRYKDYIKEKIDPHVQTLQKEFEEKSNGKISLLDVLNKCIKTHGDDNIQTVRCLEQVRKIAKEDDFKMIELLNQTFQELNSKFTGSSTIQAVDNQQILLLLQKQMEFMQEQQQQMTSIMQQFSQLSQPTIR